MKKNIFVIALDEFTRKLFGTVHHAEQYRFHALLPQEKIVSAASYSMPDLIAEAQQNLHDFDGQVDGIVCYWDFPATIMLPTLRQIAGLRTTSTESILHCEHKYWSRVIQRQVVPELVPRVAAFDPWCADPLAMVDLPFPFWIKPVKAHSSILGFKIETAAAFHAAIPRIQKSIGRFSEPFNYLFAQVDVPAEIAAVDGNWCLAEEIIAAQNQVTLEGYVVNGEVNIYGAVDSLREEIPSSFSRYHYPSRLPAHILRHMTEATIKVMQATDLDNEPFNIEFFHDPETDSISLLEINPRISKSHCPLFYLVEGASHQEIMLDLALGKEPQYPHGAGRYPMATKFMVRRYAGDAQVKRVPSNEDIQRVRHEIDGVFIVVWVEEGQRLSEFADQDSYSFEYANIFVGGHSEEELQHKYRRSLELLPFEFEPVTDY
ncbi:MAG: ATP-grasp domain-containing protein [Pelovirga sp.]